VEKEFTLKKNLGIYTLYNSDGSKMANSYKSPYKLLSVSNCDEIFGIVDVEDIRKSVNTGVYLGSTTSNTLMSIAIEQSQQPTEIEVEIVTEPYVKYTNPYQTVYPPLGIQYKLDENGCLILKRK